MKDFMKLFGQIIRFGMVGALCFVIDYGIMIFLTEVVGIPYLISSAISFTVSVIVNYTLSMRFVFDGNKEINAMIQCLVFIILSIIGLGINQFIMWFMGEKMGIFYMFSKIVATAIVMVYNFVTRKLILERKTREGEAI